MKHRGYRVVSYSDEEGYRTLYGREPLTLQVGQTDSMGGDGIFLGTSRAFCEDYYCGLTDEGDALLTYEYEEADVLTGRPDGVGEVTVRKARLVAIEHLTPEPAPPSPPTP